MVVPKFAQVNADCEIPSVCKVQLSVELLLTAAAVKVACPAAFKSMVAGRQIMVGGVMSFKVTVKEQDAVLPLPSFAVSVISCVAL